MRSRTIVSAVVAVAALATACSSSAKSSVAAGSSGSPSSSTTAAASSASSTAGTTVDIKNFMFHPTPLTVRVGATITVTNQDGTTHTLTADDHSFDTGDLGAGASKQLTFTKAGTFSYHCSIHNYMTGVIHVTG